MSHQVVFEIRNIYGRLRAVPKEEIFMDFLEVTGNKSYEGKDIPALKRIVEKLGAEYVEVLKISGKDLPKWEAESRGSDSHAV